ncbi:hypothetical protein GF325_02765 [Candidatus Bathyarchaeota archaeon]|nr:hypothetical protein [Candidatus Bathyarchaeota archaeon]
MVDNDALVTTVVSIAWESISMDIINEDDGFLENITTFATMVGRAADEGGNIEIVIPMTTENKKTFRAMLCDRYQRSFII